MENIRILIVDDLPHVRQNLAALIKLASMKKKLEIDVIGEAQNGNEAIQQAQKLHPDVILMDLEMPVMDGYQAIRSLKQATLVIWIIALSIHGDPISRQNAMQAGADAFVEKGAPLEELLQKIQLCRRTL
jgi:DNA-binding NarL/FixJ family response regulator